MDELFAALNSNESDNAMDVLKDLLKPQNIEMKSDLNDGQIEIITKFNSFAQVSKRFDALLPTLNKYMMMKCSLNRQSRGEIVKGISEIKQAILEQENILKLKSQA